MSAAGSRFATLAAVCSLTADQEQQIAALDAAMLKASADFMAANGERLKALDAAIIDAQTRGDAAALAKAKADKDAILAPAGENAQKSYQDVMAVLTAEQRAKWQEYSALESIKTIYAAAKLTADQLAKVQAAYQAIVAASGGATYAEIMTRLVQQMPQCPLRNF
ncbi:MAG: hypothetical protein ACE15C_08245 [Phycisphaerae bacterium]